MMMRRLGSVLLVILVLGACSTSANSLSGSESQVYDLSFNTVVILLEPNNVRITYSGDSGDPAILAVDIANLTAVANVSIKLTDIDPGNGQPRGFISNVDSNDVTTQLTITRGNVIFNQTPKIGSTLSGQFNATFTDGYTLDGTFSSPVNAP